MADTVRQTTPPVTLVREAATHAVIVNSGGKWHGVQVQSATELADSPCWMDASAWLAAASRLARATEILAALDTRT